MCYVPKIGLSQTIFNDKNHLNLSNIWFSFFFFVFYRVFSDFNSGKMPTSTLFLKIKMNEKWEKSRMKTVEKKECIYFMTANHSLERYEMSLCILTLCSVMCSVIIIGLKKYFSLKIYLNWKDIPLLTYVLNFYQPKSCFRILISI